MLPIELYGIINDYWDGPLPLLAIVMRDVDELEFKHWMILKKIDWNDYYYFGKDLDHNYLNILDPYKPPLLFFRLGNGFRRTFGRYLESLLPSTM